MDNIVYVLGAGFSRPLGLPIMSDFMDKGKDMYFSDPSIYPHFLKVFTSIKELAYIKTVYSSDLENIEEILSILEMRDLLDYGDHEKIDFVNFIVDVITHYTPKLKLDPTILHPDNIFSDVGGLEPLQVLFHDALSINYAKFVLGLLNKYIIFEKNIPDSENDFWKITCNEITNSPASYSIITLNYDLVLENIAQHISSYADIKDKIHFIRSQNNSSNILPNLVKLHGSVDDKNNIIPPTWNKTISFNSQIQSEWSTALNLLKSANQIRFIGYSLPITDAYVRYLFKAGMLLNNHLKSVDVICLDKYNSVVKVYNEFITLPPSKFHFFNANAYDYISSISNSMFRNQNFEEGHQSFLREHHS